MNEIKRAIAYFEDAIRESDEIIADCSPALQVELTEQKEYFIVGVEALREQAERSRGCEYCRGWDKRCGASYCPMCGKRLEIEP